MDDAARLGVVASKAKTMRSATFSVLASLVLGGISTSYAADLDYGVLRGPEYEPVAQVIDWSGFYVGVHGGYTTTSFGFGPAGRTELARVLNGLAVEQEYKLSSSNVLKAARSTDGSYGGFGGYNFQYDDIVFGVEADYTSVFQKGQSSDSVGRYAQLANGLYDSWIVTTSARAVLEDYATVRARAGYAIGSFLPFVTAGGVVGRAIVGERIFVSIDEYTDINRTNQVGSLRRSGGSVKEKYSPGAAFGAGLEYLITPNVFLRVEYQYLLFGKFSDYSLNVNTVRGALGLKF